MGSIEDNLKKALEAMTEKRKTPSEKPSVKNESSGDKIKNFREKLSKKEKKEEKSEKEQEKIEKTEEKADKKEESLEEIAQGTVQQMPSAASPAPENFFANQQSERNEVQQTRTTQNVESEERMLRPYVPTPRKEEEKSYSSRTPEIQRTERPILRDQRIFERSPIREQRLFERNPNAIRPMTQERRDFVPNNENFMKSEESERPYEVSRSNSLEKKYKLLK